MKNKLQQYFPLIRNRQEILADIYQNPVLADRFLSWNTLYQEDFLDFCSGARGVKILYDGFAKKILNPETHPERLSDLISLILGKQITILQILPNDNTRIADESSLLLMDIVVKLEDGSIANVEVQKIGYHFPGQRCACYSADLLLRQYKMLHSQTPEKQFSYRDLKNVYTIVFFEKSSAEFHEFPNDWIHYFCQKSNTGLKLNLLQEYYLFPLDIFQDIQQNKSIDNRLEAWLTFLGSDAPEDIVAVIEKYPDFKAMYEQIYDICLNMERVMEMFSKELLELDRNTVRYMIDEMQATIDEQKETLKKHAQIMEENKALIERDKAVIAQNEAAIAQNKTVIDQQELELRQKDSEIQLKTAQLQEALKRIAELEYAQNNH